MLRIWNLKEKTTKLWADFRDDLHRLTDNAFSNLQIEAHEELAMSHYLDRLDWPQIRLVAVDELNNLTEHYSTCWPLVQVITHLIGENIYIRYAWFIIAASIYQLATHLFSLCLAEKPYYLLTICMAKENMRGSIPLKKHLTTAFTKWENGWQLHTRAERNSTIR